MKYIKLYEIFKDYANYGSEWKIGDIIVPAYPFYLGTTGELIGGGLNNKKYEIIEFAHVNTTVKVKELFSNRVLDVYLSKDKFMTEEEWELQSMAQKYNIR